MSEVEEMRKAGVREINRMRHEMHMKDLEWSEALSEAKDEIERLKAEFRSIDAFATMCPDDSHAVLLEVMQMVRRAASKNDARPSAKSACKQDTPHKG